MMRGSRSVDTRAPRAFDHSTLQGTTSPARNQRSSCSKSETHDAMLCGSAVCSNLLNMVSLERSASMLLSRCDPGEWQLLGRASADAPVAPVPQGPAAHARSGPAPAASAAAASAA